MHSGWLQARGRPLQEAGGHEAVVVADPALVDHGAVVRHLNRLADAGLAALHDPQFVGRVVQAQGRHLVAREPLPAGSKGGGAESDCWKGPLIGADRSLTRSACCRRRAPDRASRWPPPAAAPPDGARPWAGQGWAPRCGARPPQASPDR